MDLMRNCRSTEQNIAAVLKSDAKKDLHIHTCYSDGALTPEQVIDRWAAEGYEVISITDHDGIDGSVAGMDYAAGKDIKLISGIEFDSEDDMCRDVHILGYGFDYDCREFREAVSQVLEKRTERNNRMMEALDRLGYRITQEDLLTVNEGRYVGKPTFSLIMYRKGYISDPQEAFRTVFRDPSIRCITKETLRTSHVIDIIHAAGGLAVFAHPMEQRHLGEPFEEFSPRLYEILDRIRGYGIDGIECIHPSADDYQQGLLREYSLKHGLLMTSGSDFHRDTNPRDFSRYHMP